MSNLTSRKWDLWMVAALVCVAVVLGIYPVDRTLWGLPLTTAIYCGNMST